MKSGWIIFALIWAQELQAQSGLTALNAGYLGAGTYSRSRADVFCLGNNQAALAGLERACAAVYFERRFTLAELSHYRLFAAWPVGSTKFGLSGTYYGSSLYHESSIGLAYARSLGEKVEVGAQFNYQSTSQQGYGNQASAGVELGAIFHAAKCNIGLQASNPVAGLLKGSSGPRLPATFRFGMGYDVSELLLLSMELVKKEKETIDCLASLEFQLAPSVYWRAGVSSASSLIWMSAGFLFRQYRLDVVASHHPQLGFSPGVAILFAGFKKKSS